MIDKVNLILMQEIINSIIELDITKENIKYQTANKLQNNDDCINISDDNNLSNNVNESDKEISDDLSINKDINTIYLIQKKNIDEL